MVSLISEYRVRLGVKFSSALEDIYILETNVAGRTTTKWPAESNKEEPQLLQTSCFKRAATNTLLALLISFRGAG